MKNLLPVGSVVMLEEANKRMMIIGIMQQNQENGTIYDYLGCLYPEGFIDSEHLYMFNHEDIEKVDFVGFADSEFQVFRHRFAQEFDKHNSEPNGAE